MGLTVRDQLNDWKERLQREAGVRDSLITRKNDLAENEKKHRQLAITATEALNFVEDSVKSIRTKTLRSIESVANEALRVVYDEDLRLECGFNIKRDRSAVIIRYVKKLSDGSVLKRVPEGSGCGVSDIVAFALRMVLIKATGCEPILVADEPFKWLGRDQIPRATQLLKYLSDRLGIQIILTSHHPDLRDMADTSYHFELDENAITQTVTRE